TFIPIIKSFKPNAKKHDEYEPYFQVFKRLYKANKKTFENLQLKNAKDKEKARAEKMRVLKFVLFSLSAGIIQLGTNLILINTLPKEMTFAPTLAYLISLVLSVIWNFTFNRKFTFKSATNVPKSMALAFLFYIFFAPASLFLEGFLANGDVLGFKLPMFLNLPGDGILGTIICMILNFALEFLWQRFVVFKDSIDSNKK
ncbi:MAG: GtrA family protein, partial [Bacilli bacterium]|nr:GtrA family protein [Bacilli bacterium]